MLYTFIGPAGMLEHASVEGVAPAPPAAVLLPLLLLQAAAKSRRAALSAAGTAARRMPTERESGIGNLQSARTVRQGSVTCPDTIFYLRISKA
jgi:hypothetical protein